MCFVLCVETINPSLFNEGSYKDYSELNSVRINDIEL